MGSDARSMLAIGLVLFTIGWLPLFAGPGYEFALAMGLVLPASTCVLVSHRIARLPSDAATGAEAFEGALATGLRLIGVGVLGCLLHGVRVGFCDLAGGLWLLVLGPSSGAVLGAGLGALVGLVARRAGYLGRGLVWMALLVPSLTIFASILRFYTSPMVFAFDPFVGFFSGSFYDTVIEPADRLLSYRAGSVGLLLVLAVMCGCFRRLSSWSRAAIGCVGAAAQLGVALLGPELGHFQTASSIEASLGERIDGQRCSVIFDSSISKRRAQLLIGECEGAIAQTESFFGTSYSNRLVVYAFRSAAQKGWLMGASSTYIAKPWRDEIYIQDQPFPHRVLPHEVAHVVAGTFAPGPFRVAGLLGGWVPDPGRIEGFAVAAAPPEDTDFGLAEWSSALLQLEQLPSIESLFRLTFLGHNSSKAYTVAGAFVQFLRERYGAGTLRAWYAGQSLVQATGGRALSSLSQQFREYLAGIEVSERTTELAKERFRRPALFGRRCPHEVDGLLAEGESLLRRNQLAKAREVFQQVLSLDRHSFVAQVGLSRCANAEEPRVPQELRALERMLEDDALSEAQRATIWESLGDRFLVSGELEQADEAFQKAIPLAHNDHTARALDVKRYAAQHPEARAIASLLIGNQDLERDDFESGAALGRWSEADPELGLADYLLAKNLFSRERYQEARRALQRAVSRELPLESVRTEAARLAVLLACTQHEKERLPALLDEYASSDSVSEARREGLARLVERCQGFRVDSLPREGSRAPS